MNLPYYHFQAPDPGSVGGERRPGIECLRMRGRCRYLNLVYFSKIIIIIIISVKL